MKCLLMIIFVTLFLFSSGGVPSWAFQGMNIDELHQKAEKGDADAQTQLGVVYAKGTGVPVDKKQAVEWYRKASDQGSANAQWNLAFMYVRGHGVKEDFTEAVRLFKLAAEQEYPPAEYDLGMMYLQGLGVSRSRSTALDWITKSADHGYKEADAFLTSRGVVSKSDTADEKQ